MQKIIFDEARAREIMKRAYDAYHARTHLYGEVHVLNGDAPQYKYVPEGVLRGSNEHLSFLYFATMTDRRQVSGEVYKSHVKLWGLHRWLYQETVLERAGHWEYLVPFLAEGNIGIPSESAKSWLPCAGVLHEKFEGNPLRLYEGGSIDSALEFKKAITKSGVNQLPGFGPKILSLLAIFYEELGVIPHVEGAFPVDVHIQRIFISTGAVLGEGIVYSSRLAEYIRPRICEICYEEGWKPLHMAHAMWFLGNQVCTKCYRTKDAAYRCPIFDSCGGAIESQSYFKKGKWDFSSLRRPKACSNLVLF